MAWRGRSESCIEGEFLNKFLFKKVDKSQNIS